MEVEQKVRVYDIEALYDFFCITFRDRYSDEKHYFEISFRRNDLAGLLEFLQVGVSGLVGFNNLSYDWPVLNYVQVVRRKLLKMTTGLEVAMDIAKFSQQILNQQFSEVRNPSIPQLDLYKIHHFDNKNKAVSLKALQIAMNWPLVADMPIHHGNYVDTDEKADSVAEYNDNDVLSTKEFLQKSEKEIELRKHLSEIFDLDLLNYNDAKIGESIIMSKISKITGIPMSELRKRNTKRDTVNISECMLPVSFESDEFKDAQKAFSNKVVDTSIKEEGFKKEKSKDDEDLYSCIFDGVRYDFGLGGLHGLKGPGVYESDENYIILSVDVSSYYANLAIRNGFRPQHLDSSFGIAYPEIYEERKNHKKGSPANLGLKQALVSVFGKSKSHWSPLYDPKYTMQITVNGQLLLAMLAETSTLRSEGHVIMANTDGLEIRVPRSQEHLIDTICKEWEAKTGLTLETKRYSKVFTRDINNYIGLFEDGKTYNKGAYEWEGIEWSKDYSMLCVPYATEKFLVKGQSIRKSFEECPVERFFIGRRAKSDGRFEIRYVDNSELLEEGGRIHTNSYSRTIRYIIGKDGGYLFKKEQSAKKASKVMSPWRVIDCMDVRGIDLESLRPRIDYRFYEQEVKKLLSPILDLQTSLV